jgi:hypothetical protein
MQDHQRIEVLPKWRALPLATVIGISQHHRCAAMRKPLTGSRTRPDSTDTTMKTSVQVALSAVFGAAGKLATSLLIADREKAAASVGSTPRCAPASAKFREAVRAMGDATHDGAQARYTDDHELRRSDTTGWPRSVPHERPSSGGYIGVDTDRIYRLRNDLISQSTKVVCVPGGEQLTVHACRTGLTSATFRCLAPAPQTFAFKSNRHVADVRSIRAR